MGERLVGQVVPLLRAQLGQLDEREAYEINMRRGRYEARRRDDGTMLTADSADALLDLIRADYAERPVSRRIAGADRPDTPGCRFRPEG